MWEYLTVRISLIGPDADHIRDRSLDHLGAQRWIMVAVVPLGETCHLAYFRRERV